LAEFLLAHGADVNTKDDDNLTPLFLAVKQGDLAKVQALIKKYPVLIGSKARKIEEEMLYQVQEGTLLHWTAWYGRRDAAEFLLARGADVNARDELDKTPLHWAAIKGHLDLVELLLAKGATVNAATSIGIMPLHEAAENGHKDVVEKLLAHGANVNAEDQEGRTPLDGAAFHDIKDVADLLRQHGGHKGHYSSFRKIF